MAAIRYPDGSARLAKEAGACTTEGDEVPVRDKGPGMRGLSEAVRREAAKTTSSAA